MNIVGIVLTVFCGLTALISASGKLTQQEPVVEILDHVEVTGTLRTLLPYIQIAGGVAHSPRPIASMIANSSSRRTSGSLSFMPLASHR